MTSSQPHCENCKGPITGQSVMAALADTSAGSEQFRTVKFCCQSCRKEYMNKSHETSNSGSKGKKFFS